LYPEEFVVVFYLNPELKGLATKLESNFRSKAYSSDYKMKNLAKRKSTGINAYKRTYITHIE